MYCTCVFQSKDIGSTSDSVYPQSSTKPELMPIVNTPNRWVGANSIDGTYKMKNSNIDYKIKIKLVRQK